MLNATYTLKLFQKQPNPKHVAAGQPIFEEGQMADFAYGLLEGDVEIVVNGRHVETIVPGDVFGVASLIDVQSRRYTAIAKTDAKVVLIDRQHFLFLVQETPLFALEVMRSYSDRLLRVEQILAGSSLC